MARLAGLHALVLDCRPPAPQSDGGSLRMVHLLESLVALGCEVTFGYTGEARGWRAELPCARALAGDDAVTGWLEGEGAALDAAILSRPQVAPAWLPRARALAPGALLVYDTVDLHFVREYRHARLTGSAEVLRAAVACKREELETVRSADLTFVVGEHELEVLARECPGAPVSVVSNAYAVHPPSRDFAERKGYLFVGAFEHPPNVDAVAFLLDEVWPRVRERDPSASLVLAGEGPPAALVSTPPAGVRVAGHVPDLGPLLERAQVMVAPLRFGAGVKGKVLLAMAHGLPVVGTPLAFEGIGAVADAALAEDAAGLAGAMLGVSRDETLWRRLSAGGMEIVERRFSPAVMRAALADALAPAREGARA